MPRRRGAAVVVACLAVLVASQVSWAEGPPNPNPTNRYPVYLHRPASLSTATPVPLVVLLHGGTSTPESIVSWSRFDTLADRDGFVVAAFSSGVGQTWLSAEWMNSEADVNYIRSQIAAVEKAQNIDPARVYVIGFSSGGSMAYRVGCELASQVDGIGIVSAVMAMPHCTPARPVSVMGIFGTADVVPFNGTATAEAPSASLARWRAFDACPPTAKASTAGVVSTQIWQPCAQGTGVDFTAVTGGIHTWSGAPGLPPTSPNAQLDATSTLWAFLSAHPRSAATLTAALQSATLRHVGKTTRLTVRVSVGSSASAVETLLRKGRAVVTRKVTLKQGTNSLVTRIPTLLKPGRYVVKLTVTVAGASLARSTPVTLR